MRIARIIVSQGSAEGNCAARRLGGAGKGIDEAIASCRRVSVERGKLNIFQQVETLLQDKSELLEDSCTTRDQRRVLWLK